MNKFIAKLLSISCALLFFSCNSSDKSGIRTDSSSLDNPAVQEEISIEDKIKNAKSIDEVKENLNGTVWHYTEDLDNSDIGCWIKVEFNNGRYTSYYALPSDGKWTQDKSGNYKLEEGRYNDTGKKYICVVWEGNIKNPQLGLTIPCEMAFTTDNFQLGVHSRHIDAVLYNGRGMIKQIILKGQMEFGDYSWD